MDSKRILVGEDDDAIRRVLVDAKGNVFWWPESLSGMETNDLSQNGESGGADKPTPAGKK